MNFEETTGYLLSLGNEVSAMKLGLENIRRLLAALGDPQNKYLKVQVAGTNGKGSVCAFLDSICNTAEIKTGTFTSPHLVSITERIRINGEDINDADFARHATFVRETAESLLEKGDLEYCPTFFEHITAIALVAFAEANVELAILETGLGGRLDATTAANAEIAVITRIDYDHQQYLGETIQEIAAEKAAIMHTGSKVVIGEQTPEAMAIVKSACDEFGVVPSLGADVVAAAGGNPSCSEGALSLVSSEATHSLPVVFPPMCEIDFQTSKARYQGVQLGLLGGHQIENAKTAVLTAEILQEHFAISSKNIADGLQKARHPGRLEFIGNVLLDGAHNVGGAKVLKNFLDEFVDKPIIMIFGAMADKDVAKIAEVLFPLAETLILTKAANSRALEPEDIRTFVPEGFDRSRVFVAKTVKDALEKAREIAGLDNLILVSGSLYLVGEARAIVT